MSNTIERTWQWPLLHLLCLGVKAAIAIYIGKVEAVALYIQLLATPGKAVRNIVSDDLHIVDQGNRLSSGFVQPFRASFRL